VEVKNLVFPSIYIRTYIRSWLSAAPKQIYGPSNCGPATIKHRRKLTKLANYVKCKADCCWLL